MITLFIVFVSILCAIFLLINSINVENEKDASRRRSEIMEVILNRETDFSATIKIVGLGNKYVFAVDENRRKVLYVKELEVWEYKKEHPGEKLDKNNIAEAYPKLIIPFEKILNVSIVEDSTIISQKSSLRTIGGAVAGGVLGGGAGAVVGGLSGDVKQNKVVKEIQVEIKLRDINNPSITIDCYNQYMEGGLILNLERGIKDAKQIADIVGVIIDDVDRNATKTSNTSTSNSVADEIIKLSKLKDQGILTEEEFVAQKRSLLNSSK